MALTSATSFTLVMVILVSALVLPELISTSTVPPASSSLLKLPFAVVVVLFTRIVPSLTTTV